MIYVKLLLFLQLYFPFFKKVTVSYSVISVCNILLL